MTDQAAYPTPPPGGLIAGDPRPDTAWAGVSEEVREESARLLDRAAGMAPLPSYDEVMASLDGCSEALSRLMDAVRGLFESAATADGYAYAVDKLRDAHDAAVDWCAEEAKRHG